MQYSSLNSFHVFWWKEKLQYQEKEDLTKREKTSAEILRGKTTIRGHCCDRIYGQHRREVRNTGERN